MPETRTISVPREWRDAINGELDLAAGSDAMYRIVAAWDAAPPPTGRVEVDRDALQTWSLAVLLGARLAEADNREGIATDLRRTYNEMIALATGCDKRGGA